MSRINRSELTKLEIIQLASKKFLEYGYSNTPIKSICTELNMSPGNLTFHFPSKEHLLVELVELLCKFQWKMIEQEANEGYSSVMAVCLELVAMVTMCEDNQEVKDFLLAAYRSPIALAVIRKNDSKRAQEVFREYCPDWTPEQFAEAEILVSGIEYATLMTTNGDVPLEARLEGALDLLLRIYGVPDNLRETKIQRVFATDYRKLGKRVLKNFRRYVNDANEKALMELLKG